MSDMLEVGALPTSLGWVVISLKQSLLEEAARQMMLMGGGHVDVNGVRFEMKHHVTIEEVTRERPA